MTFIATLMTDIPTYSIEGQQEIINYLTLQNHPNQDQLISDLLTYGRSSWCKKYKGNLSEDILSKVESDDFLKLIKQDICKTWEMKLWAIHEPIISVFYQKIKETNANYLDAALTRLAENGNPHTKSSSQILSLVLELVFPLIANNKNITNDLCMCLTIYGIESLQRFSEYISIEELNEQLDDNNESPLYMALSHYYKDELKEFLDKYLKHIDLDNLCSYAITSFTRNGWLSGIEFLSTKLAPVQYRPLKEAILDIVNKQASKINRAFRNAQSSVLVLKKPSLSAPDSPLSISQQISGYFQSVDDSKRKEMLSNLLVNGRQALFQYEDYVAPELYSVEKNYTKGQADTPLLKLLKENVYENLKTALESSHPALFALIKQEKNKNSSNFGVIERRFAEYGTKYTKSSFVLSFVLQLLFDGVKGDCEEIRIVFSNLFECVTNEGIQGTKSFEEYIAKDDLDDQLNDNQSLLFLTLQMYYSEEVERLFSEHDIPNKNNLYNLVAQNNVSSGWNTTIELELVRNKIAKNKYKDIHAAISRKRQQSAVVEPLNGLISNEPQQSTIVEPSNSVISKKPQQSTVLEQSHSLIFNQTEVDIPQIPCASNAAILREHISAPATTYTSEIFDHKRNDIEEQMKSALKLLINNSHTLTEDVARLEFETIWNNTMLNIKEIFDPKNFLNDLIEQMYQQYKSLKMTVSVEDLIAKVIYFLELLQMSTDSSSTFGMTMVEEWKNGLNFDIGSLAGDCIIETDPILPFGSDLSQTRKYISIDKQELISVNEGDHIDLKNKIKFAILTELIDEPLEPSNRLRLNELVVEMCQEILILVISASSIIRNEDLFEKIIEYIDEKLNEVNNELDVVCLRLSPSLSSTIHSNALLLLILSDYQQRKEKFDQQFEELEKRKLSFLEHVIHKMITGAT